ncbi:MAG: TIGR03619 family F420-dependent LLM class oxidoreductase [Nitrososphaerales archaeon]|jgi:probable F420-dependent oxidoreductase
MAINPPLLKFGLTSINSGPNCDPERMVEMARAAEKTGFDSLWAGGHPFLSERQSRMPPSLKMLDPVVALAFVAAETRNIRLGTGILLLPQFNPVILAKQLASLDDLSRGRLIVGIGVGWSEHEYEVLGIPYSDRGRRADDYLSAMQALWTEDRPAYHGRFVSFHDLQAWPHTLQWPYPPIVVGGSSPGAYRRAVERGNGWFGFGMDLEETERAIAALRRAGKRYTRPAVLGELEITVAPRVPVDGPTARRFSELGVHRLNLIPPQSADGSAAQAFIEATGRTLIGQV